jgi:hypothetical protein
MNWLLCCSLLTDREMPQQREKGLTLLRSIGGKSARVQWVVCTFKHLCKGLMKVVLLVVNGNEVSLVIFDLALGVALDRVDKHRQDDPGLGRK